MEHYKFKCKVCSDGRLYAGGWCHESIIPDPLPPNELLLDDLSGITEGFYTDYVWDGETLVYRPPEPADSAASGSPTPDEVEMTYI